MSSVIGQQGRQTVRSAYHFELGVGMFPHPTIPFGYNSEAAIQLKKTILDVSAWIQNDTSNRILKLQSLRLQRNRKYALHHKTKEFSIQIRIWEVYEQNKSKCWLH